MNLKPFLTALLLSTPVLAAADPLPKQMANMSCLVGNWKGAGTMTTGREVAKVQASWQCKPTSAKFGVLCSFRLEGVPGQGDYQETDLFGYEPNTDTYHWFSVTNAGETHDHVAKGTQGNKIHFVFEGTQGGRAFKEVIDMAFGDDEKSVSAKSETFVAGVSTGVLEATLRK